MRSYALKGVKIMSETKKPYRTTVYTDEDTVKKCEILYGEAGVTSFSQFVNKAIACYIDRLISENHSPFLTEELTQAIRDEVRPIASRLSKGLYRYAVILDMLCQIVGFQDTEWSTEELEMVRKFANARVAKTRGMLDIKELMDDRWDNQGYMEKGIE